MTVRPLIAAGVLALAGLACGRTEVLDPRTPRPGLADAGEGGDAGMTPDAGITLDGGFDAGYPVVRCGPANPCPSGFVCAAGQCTLAGGSGQLQVTLVWRHEPRLPEDLDLHLIEPTPDGPCEIDYSNADGTGPECISVGTLDLDANPACDDSNLDGGLGADTENIIYPANRPAPVGHYVVRVDYWQNCTDAGSVPFTVVVRKGTRTTLYSGEFQRGDDDQDDVGGGRTVAEFDVP